MAFCEFGGMESSLCGHCRTGSKTMPEEARFPAARESFGAWFPARYAGRCSENARHQIRVGDQIRSDGERGWLCSECG